MGGKTFRLFIAVCLAGLWSAAGSAPAFAACDADGVQPSGAVYRICMPPAGQWNGRLILWAHGYVSATRPVGLHEGLVRLPDGASVPELANALGYAFATTSYRVNGLAVRPGVEDVIELASLFAVLKGHPQKTYLVGLSGGGLVATLALEQRPDLFAGALTIGAPIGSWARQMSYFADVRVLFEYFFPGLLPSTATYVPPALIESFEEYYAAVIVPALTAPENQTRTVQLLRAAGLPTDPADFLRSAGRSIHDTLWFSVHGTNDSILKLGGQPFDNAQRIYTGSSDDVLLNLSVQRLSADPAAAAEIRAHYETTGALWRPLVTIHTRFDEQVPAWHQSLYAAKAAAAGSLDRFTALTVDRYGHCTFTSAEVLGALGLLVQKSEAAP